MQARLSFTTPRSYCCATSVHRPVTVTLSDTYKRPSLPLLKRMPRPYFSRNNSNFNITTRAAAAAPIATTNIWSSLVQAFHADPARALLSIAVSIAAVALSALVLAAIPTLLSFRRSAQAAEALLYAMKEELPDTAASLRLSGLEVADAVQEVTALGTDITEGVRASARAILGAEQGVKSGWNLATTAVTGYAVPTIKKAIPGTKEKVQGALLERSNLDTQKSFHETATAATKAVKRLRMVLGAAGVANTAARAVRGAAGGRRQLDPYAAPTDSDAE
ncbi:hypothetical protein Ndes2526B_g02834 [Nannochloris sp. 'desiccata']